MSGRGVRLLVRRSKTDQQGKGRRSRSGPIRPSLIFVRGCRWNNGWFPGNWGWILPVTIGRLPRCEAAVRRREQGRQNHRAGTVGQAVVRLIKEVAAAAGLDPARFAGHSLRAGLATGAGDAGVGLADVMRQTRHKSPQVAWSTSGQRICGATTPPIGCLGELRTEEM